MACSIIFLVLLLGVIASDSIKIVEGEDTVTIISAKRNGGISKRSPGLPPQPDKFGSGHSGGGSLFGGVRAGRRKGSRGGISQGGSFGGGSPVGVVLGGHSGGGSLSGGVGVKKGKNFYRGPKKTNLNTKITVGPPVTTTSDTSIGVVDATTELVDTTTKVLDISTKVPDTTTKAVDTTTEVVHTTPKVVHTTTEVLDTTTNVLDTTTKVPDTTTKLVDTTTEIVHTTTEVVNTATAVSLNDLEIFKKELQLKVSHLVKEPCNAKPINELDCLLKLKKREVNYPHYKTPPTIIVRKPSKLIYPTLQTLSTTAYDSAYVTPIYPEELTYPTYETLSTVTGVYDYEYEDSFPTTTVKPHMSIVAPHLKRILC